MWIYPQYLLQSIVYGVFFAVILAACILRSLERALGVPHTVVVVLTAAVVQVLLPDMRDMDLFLTESCRCKYDVVIVLLPALVFATMHGINYYIVRKCHLEMALFCLGTTATNAFLCSRYASLFLDGESPALWIVALGCLFASCQRESMFLINLSKDRYPILSTMLNTESLVSTIVTWDILTYLGALENDVQIGDLWRLTLRLVASLVVGALMAHLAMHVMSFVEPEPPYAVVVLMGLAYLSFMLLEEFGGGGVCAVVAFAIVTNNHVFVTSSDLEEHLTRYWAMIYEISEVIALFIACMYTAELLRYLQPLDVLKMLLTYLFVICARVVSVILPLPALEYFHYHIRWQQAAVLVWFGMRGSFRLLLLLFYQQFLFVNTEVASKGILHMAGVVFLTSFVNPMLYNRVLKSLGLQGASASDDDTMLQAQAYLRQMAHVSEKRQRGESYFMAADWKWVAERTRITTRIICAPLRNQNFIQRRLKRRRSTVTQVMEQENAVAAFHMAVENALRIHQVSFSRQFQEGRIQRRTLMILLAALEYPYDTKEYLDSDMIRPLVAIPEWTSKLKQRWSSDQVVDPYRSEAGDVPYGHREKRSLRELLLDAFEHPAYGGAVAASALAFVLCSGGVAIAYYRHFWTDYACLSLEAAYVFSFSMEMILLLYVHGERFHRMDTYSKLDVALAILCQITLFGHLATHFTSEQSLWRVIAPVIMALLVALRTVHVFKYTDVVIRALTRLVEAHMDGIIYDSYEIALAMVTSEEEVQECISKTVDSDELAERIRTMAGRNRLEVLKHIVNIQSHFPGVAVAFKSRQACQAVLNQVFNAVLDLYDCGSLDRPEFRRIRREITASMKKSLYAPCSFRWSYKPIAVLRSVPWLAKASLRQFVALKIRPVSFEPGQVIIARKTHHDIFVTYSGVVKVTGHVDPSRDGALANSASFLYFVCKDHLEDFIMAPEVLGMLTTVSSGASVTEATAETAVNGYLIPKSRLMEALATFTARPSFLFQIWLFIARRLAAQLLQAHPKFQMWPAKKIVLRLENLVLPNLDKARRFLVTPDIEEVILIQGIIQDAENSSSYVAPTYIPRTVRKVLFPGEPSSRPRPVVALITKRHYRLPSELDWPSEQPTENPSEYSPSSDGMPCRDPAVPSEWFTR